MKKRPSAAKRFSTQIMLLLVMVTVLAFFPAEAALAAEAEAEGKCGDDLTWVLDSQGVLTVSGDGDMYDYPLGASPWYAYREDIRAVVFAGRITAIGDSAFYECSGLTELTIPSGVSRIGDFAFWSFPNSKLTAIKVDGSSSCFSSQDGVLFNKDKTALICYPPARSGKYYTVPDSVVSIGAGAFKFCGGLSAVTIPAGVSSIGDTAFYSCLDLVSIDVDDDNAAYSSRDGVLFDKEKNELISYPAGKRGAYAVPDSVTRITQRAFRNCGGLTEVTIPDSVTGLGDQAFSFCTGLTAVNMGRGVSSIGDLTFNGCLRLADVYYGGTEAQWETIAVGRMNDPLLNAVRHVNSDSRDFADVAAGQWYYEAVSYAVDRGLMNGMSDTAFAPEGTLSRAMLVTILYRLDGSSVSSGGSAYTDVAGGSWYEDAVKWADANGIVKGFGNGCFRPDDSITREQMAAILYRYSQFKGRDLGNSADLSQYADASAVSGWALEALQWANAAGLINGRTAAALAPQGETTRAEAAAILMRFCEQPL